MKSIIILILTGFVFANTSNAQSLMETRDEARQRHSAERYQQYQQNGNRAPLGGYNERLSDPAPSGTERPGYASPQPYGSNYNGGYQQRSNSRGGY